MSTIEYKHILTFVLNHMSVLLGSHCAVVHFYRCAQLVHFAFSCLESPIMYVCSPNKGQIANELNAAVRLGVECHMWIDIVTKHSKKKQSAQLSYAHLQKCTSAGLLVLYTRQWFISFAFSPF